MSTLMIRDLKKSFGDKAVLNGLSFSISPGEIYCLLGPNGSGKTTTINILCNLLEEDGGSVRIAGERPGDAAKRCIGFAPQEISIYRDLSCAENLNFFARLHGMPAALRKRRVAELIEDFRLEAYADTCVGKLSGGWARRVNIAVALVHQPRLLILDEPTAALDIEARHELWQLLRSLNTAGMAVLLTTHHLEEAELLCSRIGIVHHGKLAAEGTVAALRATIPAQQLASVEAEDEKAVSLIARQQDWQVRRYGGKPTFWLPRTHTLAELVEIFSDAKVSSISLDPVRLEHIYLENTGGSAQDRHPAMV